MSTNNVMPRLCGFVIAAILVTIVIITSWNSGFEYENRIQIFALAILLAWGVALWRAKGWEEYSRKEIGVAVCFLVYLGICLAHTWDIGYICNTPIWNISAEIEGIKRDTLYHNAMASSIANYGYPSLLVNSDAFHNYHFGSHYILGMLAKFMYMPTFFVYCYIYPLVFFPLYPCLILSVGRQLRKYLGLAIKGSIWDIVALMVFMTYFILPEEWMSNVADWKTSWTVSESFLLANIVCLIFFFILLWYANQGIFSKKAPKGFFSWVVIPIFIIIMSLCKISVGAICVTAIIYYLFRSEGIKYYTVVLSCIYAMSLFVVYYIPSLFYSPVIGATASEANSFSFVYFPLHNVVLGCQGVHILIYFMSALVFFGWQIKEGMPTSIREIIKSRRYIIEETLAVICIVGYLPGCMIAIGGGSSFYFSAIQQLYAITLLIGFNIPYKIYIKVAEYYSVGTVFRRRIIIFVFLLICYSPLMNTLVYANTLSHDIKNSFQQYDQSSKDKGYWHAINEINKLTAGHKENYYIYVCPSANVWQRFKDQDGALFFYPGMTGVVCIGELYQEDGKLYTNDGREKTRGYSYKPLADEPKLSEQGAVEKARQDGKKAVIFLYEDKMRVQDVN